MVINVIRLGLELHMLYNPYPYSYPYLYLYPYLYPYLYLYPYSYPYPYPYSYPYPYLLKSGRSTITDCSNASPPSLVLDPVR